MVVGHNRAQDSENKIHDDQVARRYGFRGGLVPGVTVHGYLAHPGVIAWGSEWLERGVASIVLAKPVYQGDEIRVEVVSQPAQAYEARILGSDGVMRAQGRAALALDALPDVGEKLADVPVYRGDPLIERGGVRAPATRDGLEVVRKQGMRALEVQFDRNSDISLYSRDPNEMPALLQPGNGGFASAAYTLSLANWILGANVNLGPWIHVESDTRNYAAIPEGATLRVEASISQLFERAGHEFVELDVGVFLKPEVPVFHARHRAIYRLREPNETTARLSGTEA